MRGFRRGRQLAVVVRFQGGIEFTGNVFLLAKAILPPLFLTAPSKPTLSRKPSAHLQQMPSLTIKDAARSVLSEAGRPLSVLEITRRIADKGLFTFKVAQPKHVVLATLKRHSANSHSCSPAKQPCFREVDTTLFELFRFGEEPKSTRSQRPL